MAKQIDDAEIPMFAGFIHENYTLDGLNVVLNLILKEAINTIQQKFPTYSHEDQERIQHILEVEIIVKFCQHAEDLAMLSLAFKSSYHDSKSEKLGLYNTMSKYGLSEIVDFYLQISLRRPQFIAKFFGYSPLAIQTPEVKEFLEKSCNIIRNQFEKISKLYLELKEVYDAYKHGYRISFAKDNNTFEQYLAFIDSYGKSKLIKFDKAKLDSCFELANLCKRFVDGIIKNHGQRAKYEESGGVFSKVNMTIARNKGDPLPENFDLTFSKRGDSSKQEIEECRQIYEQFKDELEKIDNGKLIAIDLDNKTIIAKDYLPENLAKQLKEIGNSSRIAIRRVGKNESSGIDVY